MKLSDEQQHMVDLAVEGRDIIVDSTVGSGKTSTIQVCCAELSGRGRRVLYLTYSRLLKMDAQKRVGGAYVQNFHGVVYPSLLQADINCNIADSIRLFNENFETLRHSFGVYDTVVVDEYQDLTEEYAELLVNIRSMNPAMQLIFVGDVDQKVKSTTSLDAQQFVTGLCDNPAMLGFTRSFRMGEDMGRLLAAGWDKTVVGVNPDQQVSLATFGEAMARLQAADPGEVLCLGRRNNGWMTVMLNELEKHSPETYNKDTVYASIADSDDAVTHDENSAIFTTFDSAKGLERDLCVVFDYDEEWWNTRMAMPNVDPVVLRNVFLVAASRGKKELLFVGKKKRIEAIEQARERDPAGGDDNLLGFIPVTQFQDLPGVEKATYKAPVTVTAAFSFKYAEDVVACMDLVDRERLDDGSGTEISVQRSDGLIDLSPAVGNYQEAVFFTNYDAEDQLQQIHRIDAEGNAQGRLDELHTKLSPTDAWNNALVICAADTQQDRYIEQVDVRMPAGVADRLAARLSGRLDPDVATQTRVVMTGGALAEDGSHTPLDFVGLTDTMSNGVVTELKFVSELGPEAFLQTAMYVVMSGSDYGVLWNTRTDERWRVSVPVDRHGEFLDAVVRCVTKRDYVAYGRVQ